MKQKREKQEKNKFIVNDKATIWIPVRLLIGISIIAFFTFLLFIGTQIATNTIQQNNFYNNLMEIKESLESLYRHGDSRNIINPMSAPGSKRVFSLAIPDAITYVGFGRKENDSLLLASCIHFDSAQGVTCLWLDTDIELILGVKQNGKWYPNQNKTGFFLSSGSYQLIAELVSDNSNQFILLYVDLK